MIASYFRRCRTLLLAADARAINLLRVAGGAYLGRFTQAMAVLITLPIARNSLSPELFGVWMMLSALVGFMGFADFGVGNSVLNQVTLARATNNKELLRKTLAAGYCITGLVAVLLCVACLAWFTLSAEPTLIAGSISPENRPEVFRALAVFSLALVVNLPASLIQRVQLGAQQGYLNGLNQMSVALLTVGLIPLTLYLGGGVAELVLATLGVQAMVNILNTLLWLNHQGLLRGTKWFRSLDTQNVRYLMHAGALFFFLQISAAFAFHSDAIVITQTLGQAAYGDFAVVQKLFFFVSMIMSAAMLGLWPAFGDAFAGNNLRWAAVSLKRGMIAAFIVAALGSSILAVSMPWILEHWLSSSLKPAWGLILALGIWTVLEGVVSVAGAFMNAANLLRVQLFLAIGMACTAFSLKWILTPIMGVAGAVAATIIAYCLISVPGVAYIICQKLKSKERNRE